MRLNYFIQNLSKRTVEIKNKSTNSRELYTRDSSDYENNFNFIDDISLKNKTTNKLIFKPWAINLRGRKK